MIFIYLHVVFINKRPERICHLKHIFEIFNQIMAFSERKRIGGRALNEVIVPKKVFDFFFFRKKEKVL